jgi:hypothetical protein
VDAAIRFLLKRILESQEQSTGKAKMVYKLQAFVHNKDGILPLELFSEQEFHAIASAVKSILNNDRLPDSYMYTVTENLNENTLIASLLFETRDKRFVPQPIPNYKMNQIRSKVLFPFKLDEFEYQIEFVPYPY